MSGASDIDRELKRLREELERAESPDPVDVAVVEALASSEVQEFLLPVLDSGAHLVGVILEAAGTMEGVVQLTFDCDWVPGASHATSPPAVTALVEVAPPRVLKAERITAAAGPPGVRFAPPIGLVPPVLRSIDFPTASEALQFNLEANQGLEEWMATAGFAAKPGGGGVGGLTTGTKCTSLLCFEKTADDFDRPLPRPRPTAIE